MSQTTIQAVEPVASPAPVQAAGPAWEKFQELVTAAVDLFNRGSVRQAAILLDLAETWQIEQSLDHASVDSIRDRLGHALDGERLRESADNPLDRPSLRAVLRFFSAFACGALLDALRSEPRRERRRWLLLMLETHGAPARAAARERLAKPFDARRGAEEWYFRRNLLHLLRRIPRSAPQDAADEVAIAVRHARLGLPSLVVKEAIGVLGQIRDDRAENALVRLLAEIEDMLPTRQSYAESRNLPALADRTAAALAAFPSHRAHAAVIDYAERALLESGRPMACLAAFGGHDLSSDDAAVDRLVGLIRRGRTSSLSRRLLFQDGDEVHDEIVPAIEALASTPLPAARRALERVARRHPEKSSGRAAARILAGRAQRVLSAPGRAAPDISAEA